MKNYVKNKDLYGTVIPSKNDNTWELNKYMKSDKMAYIIFAATDSFLKKTMDVQTIQEIFNNILNIFLYYYIILIHIR